MAKGKTVKTIEFLRIGNPWLVGKHVNRIVPVFVVHNLLEPDLQREKSLQAIKDLAFDAPKALRQGLQSRLNILEQDYDDLQDTTFGLLAPDRRIFKDKKNGGASRVGSLFPLVAGLVAPIPSDDGLGRRVRDLMERHASDWQERLCLLVTPTAPLDPATAFAFYLLGGTAGSVNKTTIPKPKKKLGGIDRSCAEFVDNLIINESDARRIPTLRRLAAGAYLASILRMTAGPVADSKGELPLVLVYCGMPPGSASDPLVRAASKSYSNWVGESWKAIAQCLHDTISASPVLPKTRRSEKLRQQVHTALADRLPSRPGDVDDVLDVLDPHLGSGTVTLDWCKETMESDAIGFSKAELAKRVRSLGANIGFAGPDRGPRPRLTLDTPLLGVIVRGVAGSQPIEFGDFVSTVAKRFGLVLGLGNDDAIVDRMTSLGIEGFDVYDLLTKNQELLRARLIRAGLARSYSDSHTEVFCNA